MKRSTSSSMFARVSRLRSRTSASVPRSSSSSKRSTVSCANVPTALHSQFGQRSDDLPVRLVGLLPLHRVDERAARTRGRRGGPRRVARGPEQRPGRPPGGVLEVHDLDRAAGGQNHAADVVAVVGLLAHGRGSCGPPIGIQPTNLRASVPSASRPTTTLMESDHLTVGLRPSLPRIPTHVHRRPRTPDRPCDRLCWSCGPKRLPGLGRALGTGMREFKDSITQATTATPSRHGLPAPRLRDRAETVTARSCATSGPRRPPWPLSLRPVTHEDQLSLVEHLDELRTRLIVSLVAFLVVLRLLLLAERPRPRDRQPAVREGDVEGRRRKGALARRPQIPAGARRVGRRRQRGRCAR